MNKKIISFLVMIVINEVICQSISTENNTNSVSNITQSTIDSVQSTQYALYNLMPRNIDQLRFLQNLNKLKYVDVVFWSKPVRVFDDVQVMVNVKDTDSFIERLGHFNLTTNLLLKNVQSSFDEQTPTPRLLTNPSSWESYPDLQEINLWLQRHEARHTKKIDLKVIGKSTEGRDIYAVGIVNKNTAYKNVIIEGGIHGNEWISPTFVMFMFDSILLALTMHSKGSMWKLAIKYNWYFIPVANPDGFDYNQKKDRLWRKNRARYGDFYGVDLNRNFNFSFGKHAISKDPKSEDFCGSQPFSEPETKAIANFINSKSKDLTYYFAIHSYGQKIIVPFSDTVKHVHNYRLASNLAKQAAAKIYKTYRTKFDVGTNFDLFGYKVSGQSTDWVKRIYGVPFVYTFLLRDQGSYGYALPNHQIAPSCHEALDGIVKIMTSKMKRVVRSPRGFFAMADSVRSLYQGNFVMVFLSVVVGLFLLH